MIARARGTAWFVAAYGAMIGGGIALFLLIRSYGDALTAPAPAFGAAATAAGANAAGTAGGPNPVLHVLLALAAMIVLGRVLGTLLQSIGQPPVMGEVLAGICLGPSLLGRVAPGVSAYILPQSIAPFLNVVAQLGIVLYMFLVGLELNADRLRDRAHATVATSHASILMPFVLGSALALYLYPRLSTLDVQFTSFALFMGVAMSITAFPVLARILTDQGISKTELGTIALTCAAVDDVTAWCLLALAIGVAQGHVPDAIAVTAMAVGFITVMFVVIRPLAIRLVAQFDSQRPGLLAFVIVALLVSALSTEMIGVHAVFGAFLLGTVIPHDSLIAETLKERLETIVTVLLLPAFFAFTGMRTEIGLLDGLSQWLLCGLIVLVATLGKFGGTFIAARLTGMDRRGAASLGALMNTRGLMQLIVLNIGLDLHVISPTLFTMLVLMALITTLAAAPALQLLGTARVPLAEVRVRAARSR